MTATLRTVTLGCRVNQYETEYARQALQGIGYRDALPREAADLCLVNTCTVTAEGDAKSRQVIRRLARENPSARIVVLGCYASRAPEEVAALPGVSEVLADRRELGDLLGRFGVIDLPDGIGGFAGRRRAYVKVQDGCLLRCSFCIIPRVRPGMRSRPAESIVAEVERLVAAGHREIVLCGIHLGHYGVDLNRGRPKSDWIRLADLVARLVRLPGEFRIRLSSLEATEITRPLLDAMAQSGPRVCPHLHVALQSGSDRVLRRMRRRWTARRIIDRCHLARELLPHPALTSDVIVGFPGETDADFDDTCRVTAEIGFAKLHVFPFSPRSGTAAATFEGQVPAAAKSARAARLVALGEDLRRRYLESLVGRRLEVLVEGLPPELPDRAWGTACRYMPVELGARRGCLGQLVTVVAGSVVGGRLVETAVSPARSPGSIPNDRAGNGRAERS